METAHWLTLAAMSGGLVAFLGGLMQYLRAQRWKRAEFVANEMKEFKADPMVRNALLLLDWNERAVELCPHEANPDKRCVRVEDRVIALALVPHVTRSDFSPVEIALRDVFDRFFDRLERCNPETAAAVDEMLRNIRRRRRSKPARRFCRKPVKIRTGYQESGKATRNLNCAAGARRVLYWLPCQTPASPSTPPVASTSSPNPSAPSAIWIANIASISKRKSFTPEKRNGE